MSENEKETFVLNLVGEKAKGFEYDLRGLIMSFFPGTDIVTAEEPERLRETLGDLRLSVSFEASLQEADHLKMNVIFRDVRREEKVPEKEAKNYLKRAVYSMISEKEKKELVWGTLTGIRPTKLAMTSLKEGFSTAETEEMLRRDYYVSEEKSVLCTSIAKRENDLFDRLDCVEGYSLYIGIPFCPSKCLYCSFTSYPLEKWKKRVDLYLEALYKELDYAAETFAGKKLNSIYIGGGTPTTLTPQQLDRLLNAIERKFSFADLLEFTVEGGRPDSITRDKLRVLHKHPVTRISINPQSMKDATLEKIGRKHSVEQVREAFAMAREEGFDNINMDIILGLPEETDEDVADTLAQIAEMNPDNLTVHTLALKRASRLNNEAEYGSYRFTMNPEEVSKMMVTASAGAARMGMEPYYLYRQKNMAGNLENVGYAKLGKEGIYNILIMEEVQTIVACGAGTVTKRVYPDGRIERCDNVKDVALYIDKIEEMIDRKRQLFAD